MVLRSDKEKVKTLLSETIRLLCKNGLHFKSEFCVEALVGITLDKNEEFFLSIKETVKTDLVPSTREGISIQRKLKSEKKNRDVVVKGELGSSPVAKKRPAETVTSEGETRSDSGELGNLSLGEEGDQQFWSSVTEGGGGGDNEGGGTPFKKRHIQHPDESSNSEPQIVIKGEPESDSDIEEIASTSQESHQQPSNMSNMPASFTSFGSPSTSSQSFSGSVSHTAIAQQVWDQLPPFSTLPGTSGIPSTPNTVTTPDGQQQIFNRAGNTNQDGLGDFSLFNNLYSQPGSASAFRFDKHVISSVPMDLVQSHLGLSSSMELRILYKLLVHKGSSVLASTLMSNFASTKRPNSALIQQVFKHCQDLDLGVYTIINAKSHKFIKHPPERINTEILSFCGISLEDYEASYLGV